MGPFVDDTDGKTAETGLTIEDSHIRVSKAGANFIDKNETTNAAHDETGVRSKNTPQLSELRRGVFHPRVANPSFCAEQPDQYHLHE